MVFEKLNFSFRYCEPTSVALGVVIPEICPPGSYCPEGTGSKKQYLCPKGTFSNESGLVEQDQCISCLAGQFCGDEGKAFLMILMSGLFKPHKL